MKVLVSTQSYIDYDGHHYYGNSIAAMYQKYKILGNDITFICHLRRVEKSSNDPLDDNVNFVFIKRINSVRAIFKRYSKYNDIIAEEQVRNADICMVHLPSDNGYQVIKYCNQYKKPYMTVVCGCPWDVLWNYDWRGKLLAYRAYRKLKKAQIGAQYSIYVTNKFLQNRYPTKGKYIGCSNVNIATGDESVLNMRLNNIEERQRQNRILRIGTAGAIDVSYKGQEYIIKALAQLKKDGIIFEYHLIGRGDSSRLKKIAEKCGVDDLVYFHGALPHEEVTNFYDDIDIYAHPSKTEGLPRALVESESRGCLCLGSKVGGITELLEDDYLFPAKDVSRIIKILSNINHKSLCEQAIRNFNFAKSYDCHTLNEKRKQFILDFQRETLL